MTIQRTPQYPYPTVVGTIAGIWDYLKRLYNALVREGRTRISDFDLLKLSNVPWVDVRAYGAKGDGTTDDTAAIKGAIDSIATDGGIVFFPEGTYIVNPYVNAISAGYYAGIWVPGHTTIMGAGIDTTVIKLGANQDATRDGLKVYIIANKNIAATYLNQHVKICDLTIDGNNANQGTCHMNNGLGFMRLRGGIAENVKIKNILGQNNTPAGYDGMAFQGWLSTDLSFINCIAHCDAGEMSSGLQAIGCSNVKYTNCWAIGMTCTGDGGVGFTNYYCSQVQYVNCHSFLNKKNGFNIEYSDGVSCVGCIAGGASSPGYETPNGIGTHYEIATDFSNTTYGFVILESTHVQIIGGRASNHSVGIIFSGTSDAVIIDGIDLIDNTVAITGTASKVSNICHAVVNYGAATPVTVKVLECYGSTLTNSDATGSVHYDLPAAVVGMKVTFFTTVAKAIVIDPNGTDQIMVVTDTAGDTLTGDGVVGTYMVLESLVANKWYVRDYKGVWTES